MWAPAGTWVSWKLVTTKLGQPGQAISWPSRKTSLPSVPGGFVHDRLTVAPVTLAVSAPGAAGTRGDGGGGGVVVVVVVDPVVVVVVVLAVVVVVVVPGVVVVVVVVLPGVVVVVVPGPVVVVVGGGTVPPPPPNALRKAARAFGKRPSVMSLSWPPAVSL